MLDFSSALYLGMRHEGESLSQETPLTFGKPAALQLPQEASAAERLLADLMGCADSAIGPSTLHLFWDILHILVETRTIVFWDAGLYPIVKWCLSGYLQTHIPVRRFPHHDWMHLKEMAVRSRKKGFLPLIVSDTFCTGCGKPAPVAEYLEIARLTSGRCLFDDTQCLGILGSRTFTDRCAWGSGGGGTLLWLGKERENRTIIVASLAKAFGVPVAIVSGSMRDIDLYKNKSLTRVHCSPPSNLHVKAALSALRINQTEGDFRRECLFSAIESFRTSMIRQQIALGSSHFPIQTLTGLKEEQTIALYQGLNDNGIKPVLHHHCTTGAKQVSFMLSLPIQTSPFTRIAVLTRQLIDQFKIDIKEHGQHPRIQKKLSIINHHH